MNITFHITATRPGTALFAHCNARMDCIGMRRDGMGNIHYRFRTTERSFDALLKAIATRPRMMTDIIDLTA